MNEGILGGYDPLISPTGRAFMAGEKQGMTPEQMAQSGAISFADAIALKQMAERARASVQAMQAQAMQAQQMPQPQPTVVDGYINELRAQVAGAANQDARMGGIADLPAPNVGTMAMASGGIVAFAEGGGTRDYSNLSTQELNQLSKSKDREVSRAATQALLQRTGYMSPADIVRHNYEQAKKDIKSGAAFPLIYDPRPLPSHMYDESGKPRVRSESPLLAPISAPAMEAVPGSAGSTMPAPSRDPGLSSSPFFQTQMDFNEMSPSDPNYRPVSSLGSPGLGPYRTDPRLLRQIGPRLPEAESPATPAMTPPELTPEEAYNAQINRQMMALTGPVSRISAPRLDGEKLYAPVALSDEERGKIRKQFREEGEASGLPGLLRRGAEQAGREAEDIKKDTRKETWLALAQAGFNLASSKDPNFFSSLGDVGSKFAGQYAVINKEAKKAARDLRKEQEGYQKALAEFELNQNKETRDEVRNRETRMEARQANVAKVALTQAELDFRASVQNQDAEGRRRGMELQRLTSQLKSADKVTIMTMYADAVRRGDTAAQAQLLDAAKRMAEVSKEYLTAKERARQSGAILEAPVAGEMGGFEFLGPE